jgi:hypothetical protein
LLQNIFDARIGLQLIAAEFGDADHVTGTMDVEGGDIVVAAPARERVGPDTLKVRGFDREAALRAFKEANKRSPDIVTSW